MSRIDDLIKELCPEGVPVRQLGDVAEIQRGRSISRSEVTEGPVPVLAGGQQPSCWHIEGNRSGENVVVAGSGAYAGFVSYWTGPIWVSDSFSIAGKPNLLVTKFCFYLLKNRQADLHRMKRGSGVPHVYARDFAPLRLPVPPIEVQKEIVSILDKFTQLEAELEAELEARRIQYEVTRDRLLDFSGDLEKHPLLGTFSLQVLTETPTQQLGDIVEYSRDRVPASSLGAETFVGVDNLRANKMGLSNSDYVPTAGQLTKFGLGSVLLGNIRPYLRKIWLSDREGGCSGDVLCFNRKAESAEHVAAAYLYHCLASEDFFRFNVQHSKGAKMPRGDKKALMGYPIFLPPIEVQNEIVSILDKLDALVNDITIGLPAEIAARRKQYEYYRNKLLTFKELEAA